MDVGDVHRVAEHQAPQVTTSGRVEAHYRTVASISSSTLRWPVEGRTFVPAVHENSIRGVVIASDLHVVEPHGLPLVAEGPGRGFERLRTMLLGGN